MVLIHKTPLIFGTERYDTAPSHDLAGGSAAAPVSREKHYNDGAPSTFMVVYVLLGFPDSILMAFSVRHLYHHVLAHRTKPRPKRPILEILWAFLL